MRGIVLYFLPQIANVHREIAHLFGILGPPDLDQQLAVRYDAPPLAEQVHEQTGFGRRERDLAAFAYH